MTDVTQDVIDCWRVNYGLDKTPHDLHAFWADRVPSGAALALKAACDELERIRSELIAMHESSKHSHNYYGFAAAELFGPLPETKWVDVPHFTYTRNQMRAYAYAQVAADRERICLALPGGYSVDPQWVADMVRCGPTVTLTGLTAGG